MRRDPLRIPDRRTTGVRVPACGADVQRGTRTCLPTALA